MAGRVGRGRHFYAGGAKRPADQAEPKRGPAAEVALLRRQVSQKLRDRPGNMRVLLKLSDLLLRASLAEERLAPSGDAEMERKLHEVSRDLLRNFGGVEADD